MNTIGTRLRLTTFGESHGPAIGGVIDGFPAGIAVNFEAVEAEMRRRRPGSGAPGSTTRREADKVEVLSGIYNGVTLGTPIGFIIRNTDARSADYEATADIYRPGHADYTYQARYGIRDPRGGGRASARETACRVFAGALARQVLRARGITVKATLEHPANDEEIKRAAAEHDTLGAIVACRISGMPAGIGNPVYGKLSAALASAMMSINGAHGFEYGMGFEGARRRGSEVVDPFVSDSEGRIHTSSNHSGGIQGGITNGADITFRVAFKPVATMPGRELTTVDSQGREFTLKVTGRHDACIGPRALPVVEAMAALTCLDALLS